MNLSTRSTRVATAETESPCSAPNIKLPIYPRVYDECVLRHLRPKVSNPKVFLPHMYSGQMADA